MVGPTRICLRKANDIDRQTVEALVIVPIVFESGGMCQSFNILEHKTKRALRFIVYGITEGGRRE